MTNPAILLKKTEAVSSAASRPARRQACGFRWRPNGGWSGLNLVALHTLARLDTKPRADPGSRYPCSGTRTMGANVEDEEDVEDEGQQLQEQMWRMRDNDYRRMRRKWSYR